MNKGLPSWDSVKTFDKETVDFARNPEHVLTFLADTPEEQEQENGAVFHKWLVKEKDKEKFLLVYSMRLTRKLKELCPLKDKTLLIRRFGRGLKTNYVVKEVTGENIPDKPFVATW